MALALGIREKDNIYLNDDVLHIDELLEPRLFVVSMNGNKWSITDKESTEILPGVFLSAGIRFSGKGDFRLLITAPNNIEILREIVKLGYRSNAGANKKKSRD